MQTPIDNRSVYRPWILITLWVLQLLVECVTIVVDGFAISALALILGSCSDGFCEDQGNSLTPLWAALGVALGVAIIFVITTIVQIILFARSKLTPKRHFVFEITRFTIWTIIVVLHVVSIILGQGETILSIIMTVLIWILFALSMIYASIVFHRYRHGAYNSLPGSQPYQSQYQTGYKQENNNDGNEFYDQTPYHTQYQQTYQPYLNIPHPGLGSHA